MKVKKYQAATMREALDKVKADLGADAVIIHSQQVRRRGWKRLFSKPMVEVIAAIDAGPPDLTPAAVGAAAAPKRRRRTARAARPQAPVESDVREEVAGLRKSLELLTKQAQIPQVWQRSPVLYEHYYRLLEHEVEPALALEMVLATTEELNSRMLEDSEIVTDTLSRQIEQRVLVRPLPAAHRDRPTVITLIGPTGVGKTTTLAKLAAQFTLSGRGTVSLITTDTYRIAAIPQLQTYADIIEVPFRAVYSPEELRRVLNERQRRDFVLIDTPGRSQRRQDQLDELRFFVKNLPGAEIWLTLSCSVRYRDLLDAVKQFGNMEPNGLVITKLDETASFGSILNLVHAVQLPLTYFATGQSVPDDLEAASARRVAALLLSQGGL